MKKWHVLLTVLLAVYTPAPSHAGIFPYIELRPTTMAGTGIDINQEITGNVLRLTIELQDKSDVANFGLGLGFDPNEYELESINAGTVIKNADGQLAIGSLYTLKDNMPLST